jgi:hypothetical protein
MLNGEKWYLPHCKHAYQRLQHVVGWSHGSILIYVGVFNTALLLIGWLAFHGKISATVASAFAFIVLCFYYGGVEVLCRNRAKRSIATA